MTAYERAGSGRGRSRRRAVGREARGLGRLLTLSLTHRPVSALRPALFQLVRAALRGGLTRVSDSRLA